MNFNFNEVNEPAKFEKKFLDPGIHKVKVIETIARKAGDSPILTITVQDNNGSICTDDYFLNTEVREGKKTSAFMISAQQILQLVQATNNCDHKTAKVKLGAFNTPEDLATKFSTLTVGKEFAIRLVGEWVNPQDATKRSYIKSAFGNYEFATTLNNIGKLKPYDPNKDVRGVPASTTVIDATTSASNW